MLLADHYLIVSSSTFVMSRMQWPCLFSLYNFYQINFLDTIEDVFKNNKNLLIIAVIAIVNALGYGIIIPILYTYSKKYGLSDFENGLLFALFSICQFLSAPLIGRLSDKFGRRPLLILSLVGTTLSFIMTAFAPNAFFLFVARALDGLTAGNLPVASAVIADTTEVKDRAKGFGIIGASFGFGFIFGPAISALTVGTSASLPFIIAAIISLIAVIITAMFLPETNKHTGIVHHSKLFDLKGLFTALFTPTIGIILAITLFYSITFSMYVYAFQPYSVKVVHLTTTQISIFFSSIGIIGLITQVLLIGRFSRQFGPKKVFAASFLLMSLIFFSIYFAHNNTIFIVFGLLFALVNSFSGPLIQTILSENTDVKSQGSIQGLNASYMSIGQIIGPIAGGALTTLYVEFPFLGAAVMAGVCFVLSLIVLRQHKHITHAYN